MGILKESFRKSLEEFNKLGLGHAEEFNEEIDLVTTTVDETKYDAIDITSVDVETIEDVNRRIVGLEALSKKVLLHDFILRLRDSEGTQVQFLVHCYDKRSQPVMANDGKKYRRFIDLYQLDQYGNRIENICQVVFLHNKFPLRYQIRRVGIRSGRRIKTSHIGAMERYRDLNNSHGTSALTQRMATSRLADPDWEKRTEYVLYHYLFALHEMVNCPERFVESKDGAHRILKGVNEVPKTRTVVKSARVLRSPSESEGDHVIQCPYWTVRGHYRTLKSGRKVWVRPYAKGKDRHNPDQIVAKTYDIG